ncbi:MAG TPA: HEAT repeat domain-containing protein [Candidatus Kapabacteria bacterium]|nr:HEAT repeat domain-containing protein [Candidatus Kapabacteria bacterium]
MNFPASLRSLVLLLPILLVTASAADSDSRYKFQQGTTNGYRVTISSASEGNPRRFEGIILVGVRSVKEDVATIFFRGRLLPKEVPNAAQQFGGPMFHPHQFAERDAWQQMFRMSMLPPINEVQIDAQGRALRTAGLPDLPRPLENFAALLFPTLPTGNETTTESTVVVDEEPSRDQRFNGGFHPGMHGNAPSRLTGIRKETSRKLESTNGLQRFSHEVDFRSLAKTDDQPRLTTKSKVESVFDPATGQLQNLKLEGNSTVSTLDVLRKSSLAVSVEKVAGDELARAIGESAERSPNLTGPEVDALLDQFKGDDQSKRTEAVKRLLAANLDPHAKKLLPVFLPFLNDDDHSMKLLAGRVLARAATEEHLPILYRILKQDDMGQQHEAIQAIGRIGKKESIQPLADMIAYGSNNAYAVAEALGQFGSAAEEAALGLLKEKHLETRRQACQILNKVGTSKSLETLQAVIAAGDPQLINEASESVRAIRQRGDEAAKLLF